MAFEAPVEGFSSASVKDQTPLLIQQPNPVDSSDRVFLLLRPPRAAAKYCGDCSGLYPFCALFEASKTTRYGIMAL